MPSLLETAFVGTLVPVLVAVISAPATTAPVESVTVPVIEARLAWAAAFRLFTSIRTTNRRGRKKPRDRTLRILPPWLANVYCITRTGLPKNATDHSSTLSVIPLTGSGDGNSWCEILNSSSVSSFSLPKGYRSRSQQTFATTVFLRRKAPLVKFFLRPFFLPPPQSADRKAVPDAYRSPPRFTRTSYSGTA